MGFSKKWISVRNHFIDVVLFNLRIASFGLRIVLFIIGFVSK